MAEAAKASSHPTTPARDPTPARPALEDTHGQRGPTRPAPSRKAPMKARPAPGPPCDKPHPRTRARRAPRTAPRPSRYAGRVAVVDVSEELKSLSSTMESIEAVLDLDRLRAEIAVLEEQAAAPSLWDDPEAAQKITSKLSHLQAEVRKTEALRSRLDDLGVLFELAEAEDDADTRAEAESELASVRKALDEMEVRTLLSGEYDAREALVNIRAEAGGVDAADFAEKLQRMYLRWAEQRGYKTEVYETSYAEEAGIKSTTFAVQAPYAYGTLSVEQGTHRLVRISPSTTRAAARPPSPASRSCRWSSRPTTSRSTSRSCGSTCTAPRAPAARASTPPTRRCA